MIKRYSSAFWILNLSTFLFFFSFNVILPELPDYISSLGGEDYKGFIIGVFTLMAAFSRPISGKLADTIGRLPVMYFGGIVCIVAAIFYPIFTTVFAFLMIRVFHGFSTGFLPTGAVAYIADIVPADRRGEAMGVAGIMNNIGFMAGNAVSSLITQAYGINNLFYFSGIIAVVSIAILLKLPETLKEKQSMKWKHLRIRKEDVYDSRVLSPAIVMILTTLTFGTVLTLIPDYSKGLGIMNKGLFLTIATISTVAVRIYAGKLSDRIGRLRTSIIGTAFWILTTLCLASLNIHLFYLGAILMGTATGMNSPAIFAWVVDIADGERSGRAMATLFISMEIGIATGAFLSAWIYGNVFENLRWVFVFLTIANVVALLYLYRTKRLSSSNEMS